MLLGIHVYTLATENIVTKLCSEEKHASGRHVTCTAIKQRFDCLNAQEKYRELSFTDTNPLLLHNKNVIQDDFRPS